MAENNFAVAAFQQLYGSGATAIPTHPAAGRYWQYTSAHTLPANGFFPYQQASAAATLQKPLAYRLYPPTMMLAGPSNPLGPLTASSSLSSLSNYYRDSESLADGRDSTESSRGRKRERSTSPESRDRSPPRKLARIYPPSMIQGGSSNSLGSLAAGSNLPDLNNYYTGPETVDAREVINRTRQRARSQSQDRSPIQKEDSSQSIRAESDEESIHDI